MKKLSIVSVLIMAVCLTACKMGSGNADFSGRDVKFKGDLGSYVELDGPAHFSIANNTPAVELALRPSGTQPSTIIEITGRDNSSLPIVRLLDRDGRNINGVKLELDGDRALSKLADAINDGADRSCSLYFEGREMDQAQLMMLASEVGGIEIVAYTNTIDYREVAAEEVVEVVAEEAAASFPRYLEVTGEHVRLRMSPSLDGTIYSTSDGTPIYPAKGQTLTCTGETGAWFEVSVDGRTLYISKDFSRLI